MEARLVGVKKEVIIVLLMGERISPTGRKRFGQALERRDLGLLKKETRAQARKDKISPTSKQGAVGMDEEAILHKAALLAAEAGLQPGREGDGRAPCRVVHCGREEKHGLVLEDGSVYARG